MFRTISYASAIAGDTLLSRRIYATCGSCTVMRCHPHWFLQLTLPLFLSRTTTVRQLSSSQRRKKNVAAKRRAEAPVDRFPLLDGEKRRRPMETNQDEKLKMFFESRKVYRETRTKEPRNKSERFSANKNIGKSAFTIPLPEQAGVVSKGMGQCLMVLNF